MKQRIVLTLIVLMAFHLSNAQSDVASTPLNYKKTDLKKIKWIEGKWKGLYNNKPFYEIYQLENHSTLKITSYEWNGTDSSNTSYDYVYWKDGAYYLGKNQNWKVTSITDNEIKMIPNNKASNDITWTYKSKKNWLAVLNSKKGTDTYNMEYFDPFKKEN